MSKNITTMEVDDDSIVLSNDSPYEILSTIGDNVVQAAPGVTYDSLDDAFEALDAWQDVTDRTEEMWIQDNNGVRIATLPVSP